MNAHNRHLRARFDGRNHRGRKVYVLWNTHFADLFAERARKRGYRSEQSYLALGCMAVELLTDRENARERVREDEQEEALYAGQWRRHDDRDLGTY